MEWWRRVWWPNSDQDHPLHCQKNNPLAHRLFITILKKQKSSTQSHSRYESKRHCAVFLWIMKLMFNPSIIHDDPKANSWKYMYPKWMKTLSHCPFSMSDNVLLTRIQSVGGGKSCLSCRSCLQWFLSAILLHANFKEMVLLLSDPYTFSTWSQLKAETHQSSFALFHCCEIKSVRWLQWCGELQLKTHQLSLSARQRRKWKDSFKRLTHYVQKQFHSQECAKSTDTDVFLCKNE